MGIFEDKDLKKKVQFLEDERKKLWDRITRLEAQDNQLRNEIISKTSESQSEAFQNSRKTAEYRNKTETRFNEANTIASNIEQKLKDVENLSTDILLKNEEIIVLKTKIEKIDEESVDAFENLSNKIKNIDAFTENYPDLDEKLTEIEDFIASIESNLNKSKISLNTINSKKKEFDEFYQDIFGYEDIDEDEEKTFIPGKKELLDEVYSDLQSDIENATNNVNTINTDYKNKYSEFESGFRNKYAKIVEEIKSLLPNAMTAGLSHAFSTKKEDEVLQSKGFRKSFNIGIGLMIAVSLLPVGLSVFYIYDGHNLEQTILKLPRMVLSIIPLYLPVLWFTYSANKKLNLSKRLIEEYSHKEVLSKTYEGLSNQINNLSKQEESEELRFRLLSAFLQVSSENPGKLISNYETSDHPLMEALEQSYKFQVAIDKLEGIPGMGKISAMLESKSKKKLAQKEEMVEKAIDEMSEEIDEVS